MNSRKFCHDHWWYWHFFKNQLEWEGSAGTFMNIAELPKEIISSSSSDPTKKNTGCFIMDCWSISPPFRGAPRQSPIYWNDASLWRSLSFPQNKNPIISDSDWKKKGQRGSNETNHFLFGKKCIAFFCRFLLGPWLCIYAFVFVEGFCFDGLKSR